MEKLVTSVLPETAQLRIAQPLFQSETVGLEHCGDGCERQRAVLVSGAAQGVSGGHGAVCFVPGNYSTAQAAAPIVRLHHWLGTNRAGGSGQF